MRQAALSRPAPDAPAAADKTDLRLWLRLLTCTHGVETRIKSRMKARFGLTLTQFNLLAQLERAAEGIRMGELSRRTMVTGSNVTVVVEDLVRRGLAARRTVEGDGRAILIVLTPAGRAAFDVMAAEHESWIAGMFESLPRARKLELTARLADLKDALRATLSNSL